MTSMTVYATHLPALIGCVAHTSGPVLELGSGYYSTPILHAACSGRALTTADNYAHWLERFRYLESPEHHFHLVDDWDAYPMIDRPWDVAFVDQAPGHTRAPAIRRLRDQTRHIVVHDTEAVEHYRLEPLLSEFKHRYDFRQVRPYTTVVSELAPLPFDVPDPYTNHVTTELHKPVSGELQVKGPSAWRQLELAAPSGLPAHFYLEIAVEAPRVEGDVSLQVLFETDGSGSFFWWGIHSRALSTGSQTLTIPSDVVVSVGEPSWAAVNRIILRAKATEGGAISLEVGRMFLVHLSQTVLNGSPGLAAAGAEPLLAYQP